MSKPKYTIQEDKEAMEIYFKLTGERIKSPQKLEMVHKVLSEYAARKVKVFIY